MNKPNALETRTAVERRHEHDREEMRESIVVAELLAAGVRLACEYPEAPRPDTVAASHRAS